MKIKYSQLKEMIREAIGGILNKEIVKFTAEEMEELHTNGQIEKGDKVYQYQAPFKEGKLNEARQSQFKIPYREQKNVMKILRTAKSAKVGKYKEGVHYDFGVGKGSTFVLEVDKKLEDEILSLLVQKGVKNIHEV